MFALLSCLFRVVPHTISMLTGSLLQTITLGFCLFEVVFGAILAYHWFRFADTLTAIATLIVYVTVTLALTSLLIAFSTAYPL